MNNGIEEILELTIQFVEEELDKGTPKKDIIKSYSTAVGEAFNHIKNNITNLQEENERLKEEKSLIESDINNVYSWLKDYKSRNEKAIEYNKKNIKSQMLNNILQENLYRYTSEKGFELVGDDNE